MKVISRFAPCSRMASSKANHHTQQPCIYNSACVIMFNSIADTNMLSDSEFAHSGNEYSTRGELSESGLSPWVRCDITRTMVESYAPDK